MSKRSERHEAERLARRRAYLAAREAENPVSDAQLTANKANAQLSTGPTSLAGKAISSRNHTSHGLTAEPDTTTDFKVLPNEDQSAYDCSLADYKTEWQPTTATELDLVHRLATHAWLRQRAVRLQDQALIAGINTTEDIKKFNLFARYHATHERAYNKAFSDLLRLRSFQVREQRQAQAAQIRFESHSRKQELQAAKIEAQEQRGHSPKTSQTVKTGEIAAAQGA